MSRAEIVGCGNDRQGYYRGDTWIRLPAVTARWVADTLIIERPSAHRRLEALHEDGEIERGKVSPQVVIWWIPEE